MVGIKGIYRPMTPHERKALEKQRKRRVGLLAAYYTPKGIDGICWGADTFRKDNGKGNWKPQPLSPYWQQLHNEIFKKW